MKGLIWISLLLLLSSCGKSVFVWTVKDVIGLSVLAIIAACVVLCVIAYYVEKLWTWLKGEKKKP